MMFRPRQILSMLARPMRPIMRSMKNSVPFLVFLLIVFLLIGIWTYGEQWSMSSIFKGTKVDTTLKTYATFSARMAVTLVLLAGILTYVIVKLVNRNKKINEEKRKLEEKEAKKDPLLPFIKRQQETLNAVIESLKINISSKNYLYELPWYLVIGDEGVGKTSLVNRSGQKFNLTTVEKTKKRYQMKSSPYPINWWVNEEAVLIDMPGNLIMQEGNSFDSSGRISQGLWKHFISWLPEIRKRRPLNGIVLVIDLPKLLVTSHSNRVAMSSILRTRVKEILEMSGSKLPVYIVFNKLDLLKGFDDYFSNYDKKDRSETIGFSFTLDKDKDMWISEMENSYDLFLKNLNEHIFDKFADETSQAKRESFYTFGRELAGLKEILMQYVCGVLESDRFSLPCYVRGAFFTSVFQQGIPSNLLQIEVTRKYDLPYSPPTVTEIKEQKRYFSLNLFQNFIYSESGIAQDSLITAKSHKKTFITAIIAAVVGAFVLVASWQNYYSKNKDALSNVLEKTNEYSKLEKIEFFDKTGENLLAPMNTIREATFEFENYKKAIPLVEDLGLYQGKEVGAKVDAVYQELLAKKFLPTLALGLIDEMNKMPYASDKGLEILRVYKMIDDFENRKKEIPIKWMATYWQKILTNKGETQEDLMKHFKYAMENVDPDLSEYERLIKEKQKQYRSVPLPERIYNNMKSFANVELSPETNLRNKVGPAFDIIYKQGMPNQPNTNVGSANLTDLETNKSYIISPLLTDWAYKDFYVPKSSEVLSLAMIDSWVLGIKQKIDFSEEDKKSLSKKVRELYISDYINSWRKAINSLEIIDFKDLSHASKVLETITGNSNPLKRLLDTVEENTVIYEPLDKENAKIDDEILNDVNRKSSLKIRRSFSRLNQIIATKDDKEAYIEELIGHVEALYSHVKSINDSPNVGRASLQAAINHLNHNDSDAIDVLIKVSRNLPEPLNNQLLAIANNSWKVILVEAIKELEKEWQTEVYAFYEKRLANKYPFNKRSSSDIAINDFEEFFGVNGKLQSFYDNYLKLFLEENIEELTFKDTGSLIDINFVDSLSLAWDIQDSFFDAKGKLNVEFALEPLGLSSKFRQSTINIDGQIVKYSHGRSYPVKLIWPNTLRKTVESSISLIGRDGSSSGLRLRGTWSWFRLVNKSQVVGSTDTSINIRFKIGGGSMNYRLIAEDSNNPFIRIPFDDFSLPESLLSKDK